VWQVHHQVVCLALYAGHNHQRFAEVRLRLTRRVRQWHEHLSATHMLAAHVLLHRRVAAREPVLGLQAVEDPLGRVLLLGWSLLVVLKDCVNDAHPRPQHRTLNRLLSLVAWRHRVLQHLPNRLSRYPKLPDYRTLTPPLHQYGPPYSPV
jgi:hypothetical protein